MRQALWFFSVFSIFSIICGCEERNGPFYFAKSGVVRGTVYRNSSFSQDYIEVRLTGANYNERVFTNQLGQYEFLHVPTSNLEIEFSDAGYGIQRYYNIRQSGVDTIENPIVTIFEIPRTRVMELEKFDPGTSDGQSYLHLYFKEEFNLSYGRIFFSLSPDVSYENYKVSGHLDNRPGPQGQRMFFSNASKELFRGETVYFKIYPYGGGSYFDYERDLWIHSSVNAELATDTYEFKFPK